MDAGPNRISRAVALNRPARELHQRLVRALGRWLRRKPSTPDHSIRAIEATYRETLTRILRGASGGTLTQLLAIHYALRRTIVQSALTLIETSTVPYHRGAHTRVNPPDPPTESEGERTVSPPARPPLDPSR